jgi:caspase domain-containing protein
MRLLVALVVAMGAASPAAAEEAETWRVALVVGNNTGSGARPPLRYAEDDAGKLGRVLVELGGFREPDVQVLTGRPLGDVLAALNRARHKIALWHAAGRRVVVLFYYSGHSDGQVLELGQDRWAFADLRAALGSLGAEIRLAIIDSCRSGALLAEKGGSPGPNFDIRFTSDLATSGEALLTSSAADELALESREIEASFFSHHLVSGLRGAADSSGDGRVTLSEAYHYAFVNTLLATSGTLTGPQHPAYDYRISGQGDLVLTNVGARGGTLSLPDGFDRILIADGARRSLMAELTSSSAHRIALPPGQYVVQGRVRGHTYEARVAVAADQDREVTDRELVDVGRTVAVSKGPPPPLDLRARVSAGVVHGAAAALPWLPAVLVGVQGGRSSGWLVDLELASGLGDGFRETTVRGVGGLFVAATRGPLRGQLGWRVIGGPIVQAVDHGRRFSTWAWGTGPGVSLALALWPRVSLVAGWGLDLVLFQRDGDPAASLWPSLQAGLTIQL